MRVRYHMAGEECYKAECDLTEKVARERYEECKKNPFCLWAELVGEDDDNYMDVIESFENKNALRLFDFMYELKHAL